ncbi:MAG TPA: hypothetical protein VHE30_05730 [Polyangiaceae bacterium]|nr:hypothetical protein [Polyangiaceae bacterium]
MRSLLGLACVCLVGCGSSVYRLPGEPATPGGAASTPCESERYLVIAPTRADVTDEKTKTSHPKNGLGLYRVGSNDPLDLTSVEGLDSPSIRRKREETGSYDTKQIVAGTLGAVGVVAIAVGTILFVNAFETKTSIDPATGARKEENSVNGGLAAGGGLTVLGGFGFGIAGLVVNPGTAERTRVRATRHVFFDPPDGRKDVEALVGGYNSEMKQTCSAGGGN